ELSVKVNLVLSELRLPKPEEEFTPHLTIARVKTGIGSLTTFIDKNSDVEIGMMTVDSLRLKKSILTPRGPIYETLYEKKATG
ncbi:MAG: 2'-5' RNA ligase family protein, partial [Thermofilaceae archaeon]